VRWNDSEKKSGRIADRPPGSLDLEVPEYVEVEQDPEAKSVLLSVQDNEAKDQKAMWGRFIYPLLLQLKLTIA